ncbi:autotransporter-associated beta strand repeat-containing protein [bacterium]|nr:autotransporter-associated beta strand repeat-containing protein [bacterium]
MLEAGSEITLTADETVPTLASSVNSTINLGSYTLTLNSSLASTYEGGINGTGGLTKNGTGTLTISGNATYSGATTVNSGTLATSAANRLSDSSALSVGAGAVFSLGGAETVASIAGAGNFSLGANTLTVGGSNGSTSVSGVISGSGALVKTGTGTLTLSNNNTYTGGTSINAGAISIGAANALGTSGTISFGGGSLQYGSGITTDLSARFSTAADQAILIDTNGNSVTFGSALTSTAGWAPKVWRFPAGRNCASTLGTISPSPTRSAARAMSPRLAPMN